MSSRDQILATVKQNQPEATSLPVIINYDQQYTDIVEQFKTVLHFIGGQALVVNSFSEIETALRESMQDGQRIVTTTNQLSSLAEMLVPVDDPHDFADVHLFITTASLGVAENGAVWLKDDELPSRVLPFISQQLAIIIKKESIVATMHDAYDIIDTADYDYAVFIAGPSKTADIAQSLVLGAHGPKTMTVFIM